jgi:hypothetical protein
MVALAGLVMFVGSVAVLDYVGRINNYPTHAA